MSEDNLTQLREDAALVDENTLMRYIRVFSELSNQIRFANQKRVSDRTTRSSNSQSRRWNRAWILFWNGWRSWSAWWRKCPRGGYVPVQTAGMDGEPMINAGQQIPPQAYAQPVYSGAGAPGNGHGPLRQPAQNTADMQNQQGAGQNYERGPYPCRKPSWKIST